MDLPISNISQGGNQMPDISGVQQGVSQNNGEFKQMMETCCEMENKDVESENEKSDKDSVGLFDIQTMIPIQYCMNANIGLNLQTVIQNVTTDAQTDSANPLSADFPVTNDANADGVLSQSSLYGGQKESEPFDLSVSNRIANDENQTKTQNSILIDNADLKTAQSDVPIQNTLKDLTQGSEIILPENKINDNTIATNFNQVISADAKESNESDKSVGIPGKTEEKADSPLNSGLMNQNTDGKVVSKDFKAEAKRNQENAKVSVKFTGADKQKQSKTVEDNVNSENKTSDDANQLLSHSVSDNGISKDISVVKVSESFEKISDKITAKSVENQIVDNIKANYKAGNTEFVMKLNPENLGTVTVKMAVKNSHLIIDLISNDSKTQSILVSNSSELKNLLENQLERPINVEIVPDDKQNDQAYDENRNQNQNQQDAYQPQDNQADDKNGYTVNFLTLMQLINGSKINN